MEQLGTSFGFGHQEDNDSNTSCATNWESLETTGPESECKGESPWNPGAFSTLFSMVYAKGLLPESSKIVMVPFSFLSLFPKWY